MPHRLPPDNLEIVLAELQAGIIPTSIFLKLAIEKKDPFESLSSEEARKKKRKWRKLKKKFKVKKKSLTQQSSTVRFGLMVSIGERDGVYFH